MFCLSNFLLHIYISNTERWVLVRENLVKGRFNEGFTNPEVVVSLFYNMASTIEFWSPNQVWCRIKSRRSPMFVVSVCWQSPMSVVRCLMFDVQCTWSDVQIPKTDVRLPKKSGICCPHSTFVISCRNAQCLARGLTYNRDYPLPNPAQLDYATLSSDHPTSRTYSTSSLEEKFHARLFLKKLPSS